MTHEPKGQWCERCRQEADKVWVVGQVRRNGMPTGTYTICLRCRRLLELTGLIHPPAQEWEYKYYDYRDVLPLTARALFIVRKPKKV